VPIASETACTTTLYKGYSTTAEALVTTLSLRQRAKTAVLDQMFVPGTKESILDSGAMAPIIKGTQGTGARVRLVGVTGAGVDAELEDVIFPVRTATDELYAIDTIGSQAGSTLLVKRTKGTILSLVRDNLWQVPIWRTPIIIKPTTGSPCVLPDVKVGNYYSSLAPNNRDKRAIGTSEVEIKDFHHSF
jgi:hypothetical protein